MLKGYFWNQSAGCAYDPDGNMTQMNGTIFTYNGLNQRVRIDQSGGGVQEFAFNLNGQRSSIWDGGSHTQIQGQIYWGASPLAHYTGGQTYFQHQDWLGTERMRTAYNGSVAGTYISLPFGDGYSASGNDLDAYHFAGLDQDYTTTGHAQFRQYANLTGRWLSPDVYSGSYDFRNPQSFNRYSYVLNNPLSFVDPTGYDCAYLNDSGDGVESLDQNSNAAECTKNGGYWATGAITNFQIHDNGSYTLTSLDANLNTLYTNFKSTGNTGSTSYLDLTSYFANYQIQQRNLQQPPQVSSTGLAFIQAVAQDTAQLPNVCGIGIAGYLGFRVAAGGSADTQNGGKFASGANILTVPGPGGFGAKVNYTISGGAAGNVSYQGYALGGAAGVEVGTHNGDPNAIQSLSLIGSIPGTHAPHNLVFYANLGSFGDPRCK